MDPESVKQAALHFPAIAPVLQPARTPPVVPVQYWTPPGHNSWVGDVVLKQNGRTGKFERVTTPGVPAGSTYAVSADGVARFKKSNIVFHPCQNPRSR